MFFFFFVLKKRIAMFKAERREKTREKRHGTKPPTQVPEELHYSINQLQGARVVKQHAKTTLIDVQTQLNTHTPTHTFSRHSQKHKHTKVLYIAPDVCDITSIYASKLALHNWAKTNFSHSFNLVSSSFVISCPKET